MPQLRQQRGILVDTADKVSRRGADAFPAMHEMQALMERIWLIFMYILGISQGHDASACLVKDGKVLAAAEEERFNRIKHSVGFSTPVLATDFCLKYAGITRDDVDYVAIDMQDPYKMYSSQLAKLLRPRYIISGYTASGILRLLFNLHRWKIENNPFKLDDIGIPAKKFRYIRHHDAHAASAFRCSGFRDADVLVIDGVGETDATSFYKASGDEITPTKRISIPDSLGLWYGA
ncbi:MAG: hypothetical protein FJY76_03750, partial [Candidatus Aenigmarchaeota archaeon]|nr:hypothetical protein [Candidatus Aenigmarchaeota archaeon]